MVEIPDVNFTIVSTPIKATCRKVKRFNKNWNTKWFGHSDGSITIIQNRRKKKLYKFCTSKNKMGASNG